ncbi:putative lysine methyltransferase protein [Phaeoacremonium minimum UCRPA7]|uniref:Putative lysine methyltransferase protein n=1 Tax=Phaeoacremonium minimum (strain UCR-PA7) TaxID=1286976 RepID=R8BG55_PHAM7|nr:putative lysine methyltransferase protein [Phaeoacremonium minimum UCRPA7]EON98275.1 putative lysine methyltransferase protein [Phaeoacremonium minimum UCRPA7]
MMVQVDAHKDLSPEERSYLYDLAVEKLPPHGKEAFMQQMGDDVHVKLDKNGFGMHIGTDDSGGHIGGFSGASRMNHDCRPNVAYRITNITHITTAIRDIAPGEELTISYINANLPRSERQERLSQWGFQCRCAHCSMGDAEAEASDARVRLIAELETELDDPFSKKVTAETGAQLVALYEEERLDIYLGPAYTRAALNYGLFAEEKKAKEYAQKAIGALTRQSGPKAGDLPSLEALAQDPRSHWTWGKRKVVQIPVEDLNFA